MRDAEAMTDPVSYVIDADDRIESVSGPWDAFATANGAPGLTAASVV